MGERPPLVIDTLFGLGVFDAPYASRQQVVICDDVATYHDAMIEEQRDTLTMINGMQSRPPFDNTWLEWSSEDVTVGSRRQASHASLKWFGGADAPAEAAKSMRAHRPVLITGSDETVDPARWAAEFCGVLRVLHSTVLDGGLVSMSMNLVGLTDDGRNRWAYDASSISQVGGIGQQSGLWKAVRAGGLYDDGALRRHHVIGLGIALLAIGLLHSRSSELVPATTARPMRRSRLKAGYGGIKIRELVVSPMRRCVQSIVAHKSGSPDSPLPAHLCRGHFKTYTADAPLLGRHVGTYWWEPHFRGDESAGKVEHPIVRLAV